MRLNKTCEHCLLDFQIGAEKIQHTAQNDLNFKLDFGHANSEP